jgi:hypothetical protein
MERRVERYSRPGGAIPNAALQRITPWRRQTSTSVLKLVGALTRRRLEGSTNRCRVTGVGAGRWEPGSGRRREARSTAAAHPRTRGGSFMRKPGSTHSRLSPALPREERHARCGRRERETSPFRFRLRQTGQLRSSRTWVQLLRAASRVLRASFRVPYEPATTPVSSPGSDLGRLRRVPPANSWTHLASAMVARLCSTVESERQRPGRSADCSILDAQKTSRTGHSIRQRRSRSSLYDAPLSGYVGAGIRRAMADKVS